MKYKVGDWLYDDTAAQAIIVSQCGDIVELLNMTKYDLREIYDVTIYDLENDSIFLKTNLSPRVISKLKRLYEITV